MNQVKLSAREGRSKTQAGVISAAQSAQIHATLGATDRPAPSDAEIMPPLWHSFAFAPIVANDGLAQDGHPKLGDFLPPVPRGNFLHR